MRILDQFKHEIVTKKFLEMAEGSKRADIPVEANYVTLNPCEPTKITTLGSFNYWAVSNIKYNKNEVTGYLTFYIQDETTGERIIIACCRTDEYNESKQMNKLERLRDFTLPYQELRSRKLPDGTDSTPRAEIFVELTYNIPFM